MIELQWIKILPNCDNRLIFIDFDGRILGRTASYAQSFPQLRMRKLVFCVDGIYSDFLPQEVLINEKIYRKKCFMVRKNNYINGVRDKMDAFFETFVPKGQNGCYRTGFWDK